MASSRSARWSWRVTRPRRRSRLIAPAPLAAAVLALGGVVLAAVLAEVGNAEGGGAGILALALAVVVATIAIAFAIFTFTFAVTDWKARTETPGRRSPKVRTRPFVFPARALLRSFSASSLTNLAALIAGRHRPALRAEWRGHLAGEGGHDPVTWPKVRQALGFVAAAIHLRLQDAADQAWRPIDAVLRSRFLSNLFIWGPVIATLVAIVRHDGRFGLVADDQDPVALGAFLYGVIRTGRWWRRIKLPEPKPRRTREQQPPT
jgi:hypothetical protein